MIPNKFFQIAILSLILIALFSSVFFLNFSSPTRNSLFLALTLSMLNTFLSTASLNWAWTRSNKIFYSTFLGGIIWKLILLTLISIFTYKNPNFNLTVTLISFVILSFIFNFIGISIVSRNKKLIPIHGL